MEKVVYITNYDVIEDKIIVYYSDGTVEEFPFTQEMVDELYDIIHPHYVYTSKEELVYRKR